jgi:hypothetical protein
MQMNFVPASDHSTVINSARPHGTLSSGSKFFVLRLLKGGIMADRATYRKYADECRRLAAKVSENDRRLLLEHADAWLKLAEEAERESGDKT